MKYLKYYNNTRNYYQRKNIVKYNVFCVLFKNQKLILPISTKRKSK